MGEEEYEISSWLQQSCFEMWDIRNKKSCELEEVGEPWEGRLERMRAYVIANWSRQDLIDYHMGNIFTQGNGSNGSIKCALDNGMNKIKAIKHIVRIGTPTTLETAKRDLDNIENILDAEGKDATYLALIQNDYNFWNDMDDEELREI